MNIFNSYVPEANAHKQSCTHTLIVMPVMPHRHVISMSDFLATHISSFVTSSNITSYLPHRVSSYQGYWTDDRSIISCYVTVTMILGRHDRVTTRLVPTSMCVTDYMT